MMAQTMAQTMDNNAIHAFFLFESIKPKLKDGGM
jgi:hypothetical protein